MKNNTTDRSIWILLLVSAAATVAYAVLIFVPSQRAIGELRQELETKQAYLERMNGAGALIAATEQQLEEAREYVDVWGGEMSAGRDLPTLFGEISAVAKTAGVATTRFDPEPIVRSGVIRKTPLTLGCQGTYAKIHKLLSDLEELPAAIWIKSVNLEKSPGAEKDIQAEISLVIFADNPDDSDQVDHSK